MKIGILADIHANLPALRAVLMQAERLGVEHLFVLGDVVGYYYWPAECLSLLAQWDHKLIGGNHETMLDYACKTPALGAEFTRKYGHGLKTALTDLSDEQLAIYCSLPDIMACEVGGQRAILCHGSPTDQDAYIYPDAPNEKRDTMAVAGAQYVFFGHTHYPTSWIIGDCLVVNPGSVGQPRNRQPGAHWAVLDSDTGEIFRRREDYDISIVKDVCMKRDPGLTYLSDVLTRL